MGSWTGSVMKIIIECENKKDANSLYSSVSKRGVSLNYMISVTGRVMELSLSDDSVGNQKLVVNHIKQFMRDNEINYTMEIK